MEFENLVSAAQPSNEPSVAGRGSVVGDRRPLARAAARAPVRSQGGGQAAAEVALPRVGLYALLAEPPGWIPPGSPSAMPRRSAVGVIDRR